PTSSTELSIALTSGVPRWAQKRNAEYPRALKQGGVSENSDATFFCGLSGLPSPDPRESGSRSVGVPTKTVSQKKRSNAWIYRPAHTCCSLFGSVLPTRDCPLCRLALVSGSRLHAAFRQESFV